MRAAGCCTQHKLSCTIHKQRLADLSQSPLQRGPARPTVLVSCNARRFRFLGAFTKEKAEPDVYFSSDVAGIDPAEVGYRLYQIPLRPANPR